MECLVPLVDGAESVKPAEGPRLIRKPERTIEEDRHLTRGRRYPSGRSRGAAAESDARLGHEHDVIDEALVVVAEVAEVVVPARVVRAGPGVRPRCACDDVPLPPRRTSTCTTVPWPATDDVWPTTSASMKLAPSTARRRPGRFGRSGAVVVD